MSPQVNILDKVRFLSMESGVRHAGHWTGAHGRELTTTCSLSSLQMNPDYSEILGFLMKVISNYDELS